MIAGPAVRVLGEHMAIVWGMVLGRKHAGLFVVLTLHVWGSVDLQHCRVSSSCCTGNVPCMCVLHMLLLQAAAVLHALQTTDWPSGWQARCKNPTAYIMGVVSRVVRDSAL